MKIENKEVRTLSLCPGVSLRHLQVDVKKEESAFLADIKAFTADLVTRARERTTKLVRFFLVLCTVFLGLFHEYYSILLIHVYLAEGEPQRTSGNR